MRGIIAGFGGVLTGILSAWGVGGGSILIIFMTAFAKIAQQTAQGINLLYFIPTSSAALFSHVKNKLIDKTAVVPAIICGVPAAVITSLVASGMDTGTLRKIFGIFLIAAGAAEFFRKSEKTDS